MRAVVLLLLVLWGASAPGASFEPGLTWKTLSSERFLVHFHDGEEALARRALAVAEQAHRELAPRFGWEPREPTHIVLTDGTDQANGFATPVPYNRIVVHVTSPRRVSDQGRWLHNLITHEYVHILHLDKARGLPLALRRLFGRHPLLFPNMMQPAWGYEGLATYFETSSTGGYGRGQSSEFEMLMRMEVAGGLKPLEQINERVASWPAGTVPYLYGVEFYKFLARRYGEEKMLAWIDRYSANLIPFRLDSTAEAVFGKSLRALYEEFAADTIRHHREVLARIASRPQVVGRPVSHGGYATGLARTDGAGTVYYIEADGFDQGYLVAHREGEALRRLMAVTAVAGIDFHPRAGLVVSQAELCRDVELFFDLYHVDPRSGASRRLTECGRYRSPAWSPDGARLAVVENRLGNNALVILNAAGVELERLWQGHEGEVVADLDWSPDGRHLLASVWRPQGGWNLEEFSLETRRWQLLTAEAALEQGGQYSDDGRSVLYSADYGGVFNLHRLDLDDGRVTTLTNVPGGAFWPVAGEEGAIYYSGYSPRGRDIYRLDRTLGRIASPELGPSVVLEEPAREVEGASLAPYSPWSTLRPRWWSPFLVSDGDEMLQMGLFTAAWDALLHHSYNLALGYDSGESEPLWSLSYTFNRYRPAATVTHHRRLDYYYDGQGLSRVRANQESAVTLTYPWLRLQRRVALHAGVSMVHDHDLWRRPGSGGLTSFDDRVLGVAVTLDTTYRPPLASSRVGRNVMFSSEFGGLMGGDYEGQTHVLDWREFVALESAPGQVVALRLVLGRGSERSRAFYLGGTDSALFSVVAPNAASLAYGSSPFQRRGYPLRGYAVGLAQSFGNHLALVSAEWRIPLALVERGLMAPPVGVRQLLGVLFIDSGDAWFSSRLGDQNWRTGIGAELVAEANLFYLLNFSARFGFAHGLDEGGENQFYFKLGTSF